jgi:AsmA protein
MKKPVKYLLLGLGAVVVLLAGAVTVFALTFDPNRYRDDIERLVKERTGRTLKLGGDLKLAFYPSLGASVGKVTLSERAADRQFLALDDARVSVALMPLLRGQMIVDRVRVSGLKAEIVKGKDGRYNFSDLLEGDRGRPKAPAESKKSGGGAPVSFDIAGVDIDKSSFLYRDLNSGQEISLDDVKLHTGRIAENAEGKLDFSTVAKRKSPLLEARLALNGTYALKPDSIGVNFTAKLDESSIKGKAAVARAAVPSYNFDLGIDKLNLDHYLASSEKKKSEARAQAGKEEQAKADAPVDLSGLKGLNAKGAVQIGALEVQGLKLSNVKADLRAANGRAEVSPHSANLYEGTVAGALTLDANGNRIALKENLQNVSVGPLLRDAAQQDKLEGRGSVSLDVTSAGQTVNAIKRALSGTAKVNLKDGAIKGININEVLRKAKSALGSQSAQAAADSKDRTDFSELSATFNIKNGVAHNEDLDVKAPLFRITGSGDIDIGRSSINYVAKTAVVATTQGQGGKELEDLAGLTVPVKLSGPLDGMKYEVDYRAVAGGLAQSKVGGKIKEKIGENKEKIQERVQDQVKDRLKGLFGR